MFSGSKSGFSGPPFGLDGLEELEIFDRVVDSGRRQHRVELALVGGLVVLFEYLPDDGPLGRRLARPWFVFAFRLVIIDVEAQDVAILDRVRDGVFVQTFPKNVPRGFEGRLSAFDLLTGRVSLEDRRAGEAEQLGVGEKFLDGLVVLAELRAVAFVEDEHDALVPQRFEQTLFIVAPVPPNQGQPKFLNGRDDHLVGVIP